MPQRSILGPRFFNIFINDLFLFTSRTEICNYADDNTLYAYNKNVKNILTDLSNDFEKLSEWFYMVLNPDKCHFMTLCFTNSQSDFLTKMS